MKARATKRGTLAEVNGGLSPRQRRATIALMSTTSKEAAAKAAGVGVRTLRRWNNDPNFVKEIDRIHNKAVDAAVEALQNIMPIAIKRLEEVVSWKIDPKRPGAGHVVLRAIEIVLDRARQV